MQRPNDKPCFAYNLITGDRPYHTGVIANAAVISQDKVFPFGHCLGTVAGATVVRRQIWFFELIPINIDTAVRSYLYRLPRKSNHPLDTVVTWPIRRLKDNYISPLWIVAEPIGCLVD